MDGVNRTTTASLCRSLSFNWVIIPYIERVFEVVNSFTMKPRADCCCNADDTLMQQGCRHAASLTSIHLKFFIFVWHNCLRTAGFFLVSYTIRYDRRTVCCSQAILKVVKFIAFPNDFYFQRHYYLPFDKKKGAKVNYREKLYGRKKSNSLSSRDFSASKRP